MLWAAVLVLVVVAVIADDSGTYNSNTPTDDTGYTSNAQADVWFADHDVTFTHPDDWEAVHFDAPPDPLWAYAVSPNRTSANWIAFYYYPKSVAADYGATEQTFTDSLDSLLDETTTLTHGPTWVTIAGLDGRQFGITGLIIEEPNEQFESELIILYDTDASYGIQVQYNAAGEDTMLEAWETLLANLRLPPSTAIDDGGDPQPELEATVHRTA